MGGFDIDDPMLALIARFAACCKDLDAADESFLRQQCEQVRDYVETYPEELRQERALEWVMQNAEEYRRKWKEQLISNQAASSRCPDCPLQQLDESVACEIHQRWLALLNRYVKGETSSRAYVGDTLALLRRHKERLRRRGGKTIAG